jgi:ACS family tartrate transporter-like MFS transporter
MVSWGIVSACTMFVRDEWSFYLLRILLGVAEAGFFPGIILYMSYWFPARERARAVAWFMVASPLSGVVNGPISGAILEYTNQSWGLAGWQWLFLIEGIPAVILGFVTWSFLTDRPEQARWLEPDERAWHSARMAREEQSRAARHGLNRLRALANPMIGLLILLYFTIAMGTNGYGFYAPTILEAHFPKRGADQIGLLYAIPSLVAAMGMILVGRHSDRSGERRWHLAVCSALAAIGWALSTYLQSPWLVLVALTLAFLGMMSMMGPYWSMTTSFLSGTAAAGGIALINTIANAGGVLSPALMGWMKTVTGRFSAGQIMLALTMLAGSGLALCVRHDPRADRAEFLDTEPAESSQGVALGCEVSAPSGRGAAAPDGNVSPS